MNTNGVTAQPEWLRGKCPFCQEELGKIEIIKRKVRKICKCRNCGRIIDEKYIVR